MDMLGCWVALEDLENPEEDCKITFHQTDELDKVLCLTESAIEEAISTR